MTHDLETRLRTDLARAADALLDAAPGAATNASTIAATTDPTVVAYSAPLTNVRAHRRPGIIVAAAAALIILVVGAVTAWAPWQDNTAPVLDTHGQTTLVPTTVPSTVPAPTTIAPATITPNADGAPVAFLRQPSIIDDRIVLSPAGPYEAGQTITITAHRQIVADEIYGEPEICYPWRDGEVCDPADRYTDWSVDTDEGFVTWTRTIPGWVNTPEGVQRCVDVGCRLSIREREQVFRSTAPLDIAAGPQPERRATLTVNADASLTIDSPGIEPDPTWRDLANFFGNAVPESAERSAGVGMSLCSFAVPDCNRVGTPPPPLPGDGSPFTVTISPQRLQFSGQGWIDCVVVTCFVNVTATGFGLSPETALPGPISRSIAVLPYRLPADTPGGELPTLTISPAGDHRYGDVVEVTLRNVPEGMGPTDNDELKQCSDPDPRTFRCNYWFTDWVRADEHTYTATYELNTALEPNGTAHLSWTPGGKADPPGATTEQFVLTP